jgi:hypothetical protein
VAIAALAVWALTAAAGVYLLGAVMAAKRAAASLHPAPAPPPEAPAPAGAPASPEAGTPRGTGAPPTVRTPPPIPRTKVSTPPGEHPLLEFCHPALGVTGLACWFAFVATHDRAFAWLAFAVLAVTIAAGFGWLVARARSARQHTNGGYGPPVPVRRIVLHGLAAATTCGLAIAAVLAASHG